MIRFAALAAVFLALCVGASSAPAAASLRLEIAAVEETPGQIAVTVNVADAGGRAVTGLTASNFKVALNGGQVALANVQAPDATRQPASILLLADVSGSMLGAPIDQAKASMQTFVATLDPTDRVAVVSFGASVQILQDFTTDRAALNGAIGRIVAVGDTALYDAVIGGANYIAAQPPGRRLVVLLSDGKSTISLNKRAESLATAKAAGVSFVSLGLGPEIDRAYLGELATATGGRVLEAATPAQLKQVYTDLANYIKNQYTVFVTVPPSVDRSVDTKLSLTVQLKGDSGAAEKVLGPLAGAPPPPFVMTLNGIKFGAKLKTATNIEPVPPSGVTFAKVEYKLDGEVVQTAVEAPFAAALDPAQLTPGLHSLEVVATDARGRVGATQVNFTVAAAGSGASTITMLLPVILLLGIVALLIIFIKKRRSRVDGYASRVKPWAGRLPVQHTERPMDWPEPAPSAAPALPPAATVDPATVVRGRVVVMNEGAIREGALDGIHEYEIRTTPLIFGSGSHCDIQVDDDGGRIAAEEARMWVQKGHLVYHKLTTLSAMATEGVTSGWEFLESGEDLRVGPYRIVYQAEEQEPEYAEERVMPTPTRLPREHGMDLRELWTRAAEDGRVDPAIDPTLDSPFTPQPE
ncbi:MAG TPA: VWA domain-containing protein [Dehalococcoidia bacterium]|nr:VWA domain-containing protein [Dehalococcoidia bacterium]